MVDSSDDRSIAVYYTRSLELFRRFVLLLTHKECRIVVRGQISVESVRDEYTRYLVWGEQSGAIVTKNSRGSLDQFTREQDGIRKVLLNTLQQLANMLNLGTLERHCTDTTDRASDSDCKSRRELWPRFREQHERRL